MFQNQLIHKEHLEIPHQLNHLSWGIRKALQVIVQQQQVGVSTQMQEKVISLILTIDIFGQGDKLTLVQCME